MKRLLRSAPAQRALSLWGGAYLSLARARLRLVRDDRAKGEALLASGRPLLACFWHGRLLSVALCWRGEGADILISRSRDGRMIAEIAKRFGHGSIEGSTARGDRDRRSAGAAREVVERLRAGRMVGMTPDGPRGPRMRAGMGAIRLAQMADADLVPVAASLSPAFRVGSWDRMIVPYPLPFARGVFLVGDPIPVAAAARSAGLEAVRLRLEGELNRLSAEADRLVGAPPVLPADPAIA